jgi:N-acyl-D-amino-acid deacylase
MFDVIIKGGTVIDGTRAPRLKADVGIAGDRITAVGDLQSGQAAQTIDATGKIVAPGFVDVHNHSEGWMLRNTHTPSKTTQGFTTEVLMPDGISYAPVNQYTVKEWIFYLRALDSLRQNEYDGWESIADYMDRIDGKNVQNAIPHVPYANVRSIACGFGRAAPDDFQMRQIRAIVREGMEQGAVGLSTGLDYIVQCFSSTDELVEACKVVAEYGGLYVTHMRYKMGLMPALREAVEIGRRSGAAVHISHLRAGTEQDTEQVLTYIDSVARNEVDFSFDVYPYCAGSTMLNYLLPYGVWEDGPLAAIGKIRDPAVKAQIRDGFRLHRVGLDSVHIAWIAGKENSVHQGKGVAQYVEEMGIPAEEALGNLLMEEALAVLLVFTEADDRMVRPFLAHDLYMMGSDGIFHEGATIHPRQYGSVGRVLGPVVRDHKVFSLEDAIYKLSGHAAKKFGLKDRGEIREGGYADLVVFDPETVNDKATYQDPHQYCEGIEQVIVNGARIVADSAPVVTLEGTLPGRSLKFNSE